MTVKEITALFKYHVPFRLIGANTGKTLYNNRINKEELLQKYEDCKVTDEPLFAELYCDYNGITHGYEFAYPRIAIWVSGK